MPSRKSSDMAERSRDVAELFNKVASECSYIVGGMHNCRQHSLQFLLLCPNVKLQADHPDSISLSWKLNIMAVDHLQCKDL